MLNAFVKFHLNELLFLFLNLCAPRSLIDKENGVSICYKRLSL